MPVLESRGTEQRPHEEEFLPADSLPIAFEQEDVLQDDLVIPQDVSEQPHYDQPSQPHVRRSTRERRPTHTLMYHSLGQPSYHVPTSCNTVGAFGPPPMPPWEAQPYPVTFHTPFRTLQYPTPYLFLAYPPTTPYTPPLLVY